MRPTNIFNIENGESRFDDCWIDLWDNGRDGLTIVMVDGNDKAVEISVTSAIAAARAILKHFNATLESDQ